MSDWFQIKACQIFFDLRPIWHLWLKSFRNESTLKNNFQNQNYVKRASPLNAHFTSNWCCGQDNWPKPMKFLHKKSELKCSLNLFFRTIFAFLKAEWRRILISNLAWNTLYKRLTCSNIQIMNALNQTNEPHCPTSDRPESGEILFPWCSHWNL